MEEENGWNVVIESSVMISANVETETTVRILLLIITYPFLPIACMGLFCVMFRCVLLRFVLLILFGRS